MRFVHLADLHLGRSLAEFSLIELQREILGQIIDYIRHNDVDAVVIAGDVYDRAAPSTQAVNLLDGFLTLLSQLGKPVLLIAGNHDSPERLSFLSPLLERSGVYIAGDYRLGQPPVTLTDRSTSIFCRSSGRAISARRPRAKSSAAMTTRCAAPSGT